MAGPFKHELDAISDGDNMTGSGNLTIDGTHAVSGAVTLNGRAVSVTSPGNDTAATFRFTGTNMSDQPLTEDISGTNGSTATGQNIFKTITQVSVDRATASVDNNSDGDVADTGETIRTGFSDIMSFTLEDSTLIYTAGGTETAAQARDRLLTNPGPSGFKGTDEEVISTVSTGILKITDKNGIDLFTIQSDGTSTGLRLTEINPDGNFSLSNLTGNAPPTNMNIVTKSIGNRAFLIEDGSTFFSNTTNKSEVQLSDFSLNHQVVDQEFTQRYAHALTDVKGALVTVDNQLLSETETDSAGEDLSNTSGASSYTKEEFMEMGLRTSSRLRDLDTKTLLIKNIYAQRRNIDLLFSGQMFGFAMMNFKGNFDLTKK